jgi:hypothetical protein
MGTEDLAKTVLMHRTKTIFLLVVVDFRSLLQFFKSGPIIYWIKRVFTDREMCLALSAHDISDWRTLPTSKFCDFSSADSACTVIIDWYAALLYCHIFFSSTLLTYRLCRQNSKHCIIFILLILAFSSVKAHIQLYGTFCGLSFPFYHHWAIYSPQLFLQYIYTTFDAHCLQQTCYL